MNTNLPSKKTAYFHLPGLFEFYDFYVVFLDLYRKHREYFYDWCEIGSIYGAPEDCLWAGGRMESSAASPKQVLALMEEYALSARLTLSNSLLTAAHLSDRKCNSLCDLLAHSPLTHGVIVHSDLLQAYLKEQYPELYLVSSTTKVITSFDGLLAELKKPEFDYVVPDFRLNKALDRLSTLEQNLKDKVEFLCNECCSIACKDRAACYENVSRQVLDPDCPDYICPNDIHSEGYRFSKAMKNPSFISLTDITDIYLPLGFTNFKIEGRSLGSALLLEFLLYYMTKPQYHIHVREALYLNNTLDLF